MENRLDSGGIAAVIALLLILLLLLGGGGAGVYFFMAMQTDRAVMAEAQARMEAERARAEALAAAAAAARTASKDNELVAGDGDSIRAAVESMLRVQEDAWNRGDLNAFMEHYWKSDALTASSGGKTTRGWDETLNHYRERYPTREKMGRLSLSELEITPLGNSAALVLGRWMIERESEPLSGNFSLVVRKLDGRWLIVHDHTSQMMD
jgi:uncharacterized protein (TIGR02246 family)